MYNLTAQINALTEATRLSEAGNPLGALKVLVGYEEPHEEDRLPEDGCTGCGEDHDPWNCTAGIPDWDAMAKDEEFND